jgi:excisionase family DNA binding protein
MKSHEPTALRCYTVDQVCELLQLRRSTFYDLLRRGQLPFLDELKPRLGRLRRFRADLVDRYLQNDINRPAFGHRTRDQRRAGTAQKIT